MNTASFRFYASLNDFLPTHRRGRAFPHSFNHDQSIKHLLEALGVPHPEVDLILINGNPVDFSYRPADGDWISIYPRFSTIDIQSFSQVRPIPPVSIRFVIDGHLGKLAAYLRMFGLDTLYRNDFDDEDLAAISAYSGRVLLTRDRNLLKRREVSHGYWIRAKDPAQQLREVINRYNLSDNVTPFSRCLACNGTLVAVSKEEILHRLEPLTKKYYERFSSCQNCDRIYWQGSHWERMNRFLAAMEIGNRT